MWPRVAPSLLEKNRRLQEGHIASSKIHYNGIYEISIHKKMMGTIHKTQMQRVLTSPESRLNSDEGNIQHKTFLVFFLIFFKRTLCSNF